MLRKAEPEAFCQALAELQDEKVPLAAVITTGGETLYCRAIGEVGGGDRPGIRSLWRWRPDWMFNLSKSPLVGLPTGTLLFDVSPNEDTFSSATRRLSTVTSVSIVAGLYACELDAARLRWSIGNEKYRQADNHPAGSLKFDDYPRKTSWIHDLCAYSVQMATRIGLQTITETRTVYHMPVFTWWTPPWCKTLHPFSIDVQYFQRVEGGINNAGISAFGFGVSIGGQKSLQSVVKTRLIGKAKSLQEILQHPASHEEATIEGRVIIREGATVRLGARSYQVVQIREGGWQVPALLDLDTLAVPGEWLEQHESYRICCEVLGVPDGSTIKDLQKPFLVIRAMGLVKGN